MQREWEGIRLMTDPVSLSLASLGTNKSEQDLISDRTSYTQEIMYIWGLAYEWITLHQKP